MEDMDVNLDLNKIGKEVFVKVLYPELVRDRSVSIDEIVKRHFSYGNFTVKSQKSRLSKSKRLFREGRVEKALEIIVCSGKVDLEIRKLAQRYLLDLRKGK